MLLKYFFDTEFIDNSKTIELISIGIVCEDGREYYAISNEFNPENADNWVKEHVITQLNNDNLKSKAEIKQDIIKFIGKSKPEFWVYNGAYDWVIFCQLFGYIRDLPKNYPWYANDIKQLSHMLDKPRLPTQQASKHHALEDARWNKLAWEFLNNFKNHK